MKQAFVRYGGDKLTFDLPPKWCVLSASEFDDHHRDKDPEQLTREILENPIGSLPLRDRISPSDTVTILIEDHTRVSPKKRVLRGLLSALGEIQIPKKNISVVVALGTHQGLAHRALEAVYGEEAVNETTFINHDCHAPDLVPVGTLETGTAVKINKTVHDAAFKIGIGSIFPHPLNGFGGGGKILFPGVADFASILEHHLKYSFRQGSELGKTDGNPFYESVCDLSKAARLDFIINSILDHNDQLFDMVCGDSVGAHRAGVDICRGIISKRFHKKADVTIISAFPYSEGPQIMKPLAPASMITKQGGTIILVAHVTTDIPDLILTGCERFRQHHAGRLKEGLFELFDKNQPIIDGSAPELNMAMSQALLSQNDFNVIFVSDGLLQEAVERLGFHYAENMDRALTMAEAWVHRPDVFIVPAGGVILPLIDNSPEWGQRRRRVDKVSNVIRKERQRFKE